MRLSVAGACVIMARDSTPGNNMASDSTTKPASTAAAPGFAQLAAISVAANAASSAAPGIERILEILTSDCLAAVALVEAPAPSPLRLLRGDESLLESGG